VREIGMERPVSSTILDVANMVMVFSSVDTMAAVIFAREDEKKKEKKGRVRG
jgi:hypothetical protein